MERNTENALELEAEISVCELEILKCRTDLEENPRSEPHHDLLEMLIDRMLSLEERFKNLTYDHGELSGWSESTQDESFETENRDSRRIEGSDSRYQS
jgi:hypothetical protein